MKRILLINTNTEKAPYPVPPVGLCLIAASIEDKYEVKIFDGMFNNKNNLIKELLEFNADYIGMSIRNIDNLEYDNSISYIESIYDNFLIPIKENSSAPLILGGSGYSIYPEYLLERFGADFGIVGEGEKPFSELLDSLENNKETSQIPGVISKNSIFIPNNSYLSLKSSPSSNIDLRLDFSRYTERGAYSIQTKRGCGHKCIYCTYPQIEGTSFRPKSPKSVADEIEDAHKRLGNVTFEFVDSTFNDPKGHAEEICREIAKRKINVRLRTMGINPVNVTRELFDLMLEAGFAQIDCTPDSASKSMIKSLKKNFTLEQLEKAAELIKEYNIPTMWFFIFGGPGETEKTIDESFEFIDKWVNKDDMVHLTTGLRVFPDTDLHKIAVEEGVLSKDNKIIIPSFYITKNLGEKKIFEIIKGKAAVRPNCIPASESKPPKEMLDAAAKIRDKMKLDEPMFRTLLRLRYQMFNKQNLVYNNLSN